MKTVTSKSGRKYKKVGSEWKLIRVGMKRKTKAYSPHERGDVIYSRLRLVRLAGNDRKKVAALLRRFRAADRGL